jgi:homoserine O-acetyltransferase
MVYAQHRLATDVMGLDGLYAVMGVSMGGMQTFEGLVEYPDFFRKAVPIIDSPRVGPYDITLWETGSPLLELFELCGCEEAAAAHAGLLILTNNTPDYHFRVSDRNTVQANLDPRGQDVRRLSGGRTKNIAMQLRAMINIDISRGFGGDMAAAAAAIQAKLLVIANATDHLVTLGPALEFVELARAQSPVLDDDRGQLSPFRSCSGTVMTEARCRTGRGNRSGPSAVFLVVSRRKQPSWYFDNSHPPSRPYLPGLQVRGSRKSLVFLPHS